ncbi:MAG: hypothetical protein HZC36_13450 [Armatimonadetes bacterium]|nr:hypothetical protein [Armatimonadota bacterium]
MSWRAAWTLVGSVFGAAGLAQTPEVLVRLDLNLSFSSGPGTDTLFRAYDLKGRASTVGLHFSLEPGFLAVVSQRFQKVPTSADQNQLDESYVEDPGYWRAGKQFVPFGVGRILVESVSAGRIERFVGGDQVPATLALCQDLKGLARGFVGRLGGKFAISFAFGENFGVSATSLANVRKLDEAPGKGMGWGRVYGADFTSRRDHWTASVEVARFDRGATSAVRPETVSDVEFRLSPIKDKSLTFGWGRLWEKGVNVFRLEAHLPVASGLWLDPIVRMRDGKFMDAAFQIGVKL